jgi:hypothetical protein
MKYKNFVDCVVLVLIGLRAQLQPVAAGPVIFTIDPTRSIISLSGNLETSALGTLPFAPQGTGSLTTSYTGSVLADLTPPNIQFPGGSMILANTNGTWQPAIGGGSGSAPADYGGQIKEQFIITAYFAGRNFLLDVTSPQTTLTNGGFNSGLLAVTFLTNTTPVPGTDYNVSFPLDPSENTNGTSPLTGTSTNGPNTAYLTNSGGNLAIFMPVSITNVMTNSSDVITVILTGTVVATAPASAWPLSLSVGLQNGQVSLTWPSFPGPTFTVQTTQSLGTRWSTATGVTTVQANTTTWTGAATNTAQFYRLQASF